MPDMAAWTAEIDRRRSAGDGLEFRPEILAQATLSFWPSIALQEFLDEQVAAGLLQRVEARLCPKPSCKRPLDQGMIANGQCPYCHLLFRQEGEEPLREQRYRILGQSGRDIRWMIVVHGMKTRAAWQEDLSWLIAHKLKYSAPVLIYKYGWATVDVLVTRRHQTLARELGERIRTAVDYAKQSGIETAPDILVHSFGSRLFSLVLTDPRFTELRFGRVITAGSIIRPDFPWKTHINSGQIEAVLNHVGGKDGTVKAAQFCIPGTGPSGRTGFVDAAAINAYSPSFGHSDCLTQSHLRQALASGGLWDRYLTQPAGLFASEDAIRPTSWHPAPKPLLWLALLLRLILFPLGSILLLPKRWLDP